MQPALLLHVGHPYVLHRRKGPTQFHHVARVLCDLLKGVRWQLADQIVDHTLIARLVWISMLGTYSNAWFRFLPWYIAHS